MQKEIFDGLVEKYLSGKASQEEKLLVEEYMLRMARMNSGEFSSSDVQQITKGMFENIQKRVDSQSTPVIPIRRNRITLLLKAGAVAAVILIAIFGINQYRQKTAASVVASVAHPVQEHKLLPGTDKAILTMDDGSQVVLDNSGAGAIAVKGFAKLVEDGKGLVYHDDELKKEAVIFNTVSTPRGGQYQVTLADGSRVWLNSMASIRFPTAFTGNDRTVEITGEVYFEVAKDKNKPFHVKVNGMEVQVLGTNFNINAYHDETAIKTTLLEGAVQVSKGNQRQLLLPGQQARVTVSEQIQLLKNVDVDQAVAWKNGQFNLTGANIREIMRQISRWYGAEIVYEGDVSGIVFYGTVSRTRSISEMLKIMEKTGIVHFRVEGQKIIVSK